MDLLLLTLFYYKLLYLYNKALIVSNRNKIWFIGGIALVLLIGCVILLPSKDRTFINYLGIIGFLLSIAGLIIAYLQILSVKEVALITQKEVTENIKRLNSLNLISDLIKKFSMIGDVQDFLKADKIDMCILRMKDLKILLSELSNHDEFGTLVNKKDFNNAYADFNIDLTNFHKFLLNNKNKIDKEKIMTNLEQLSTILLGVEFKLKKTRP